MSARYDSDKHGPLLAAGGDSAAGCLFGLFVELVLMFEPAARAFFALSGALFTFLAAALYFGWL